MYRISSTLLTCSCLAALALATGCTLSTGSRASASPNQPLKAGNYTLSVAIQTAAGSSVPISGLDLTLAVPPGVSIATLGGATTEIPATSLTAGGAVPGTCVVAGSYLAGQQQVRLGLAAGPTAPWSGEALRLVFTVAPGLVLSEDFQRVNPTPTALTAVGVDPAGNSTVILSDQVKTILSVAPVS